MFDKLPADTLSVICASLSVAHLYSIRTTCRNALRELKSTYQCSLVKAACGILSEECGRDRNTIRYLLDSRNGNRLLECQLALTALRDYEDKYIVSHLSDTTLINFFNNSSWRKCLDLSVHVWKLIVDRDFGRLPVDAPYNEVGLIYVYLLILLCVLVHSGESFFRYSPFMVG